MSRHIRKTKTLFSLTALAVLFLIGFGVELFQGRHIAKLGDIFKPYELRYAYAREEGAPVLTAFANAFSVPAVSVADTTLRTDGGVPVLVYHGIVQKADRFGMTEETFIGQMTALKRAGYSTITPAQLEDFLVRGEAIPKKAFLLTFDDGRLDSYVKADPILEAFGFHALMFVAVESSYPSDGDRQTFYINAKDTKKMIESLRWSVGSHALQLTGGIVDIDASGKKGNFLSSKAWVAAEHRPETDEEYLSRITREISESRNTIESLFGVRVNAFSYPFGDYGQQNIGIPDATSTIDRLIAQTYPMAFRQVWPNDGEYSLNYASSDRRHLKRFETPTEWSGEQLVTFLESAGDKPLPLYEDFSEENGWQGTWGDVVRRADGLALIANASTTGAAAFVDGASAWTDYVFNATITRSRGSHVSLMVRYRDGKNYAVCTYGQGRAKIDEYVDGVVKHLIDVKAADPAAPTSTYAVRLSGDAADCLMGGRIVASARIGGATGGVGVKIWDEKPANADILVTSASVNPLQ